MAQETETVALDIRSAFAAVVESLPHEPSRRPELSKLLGLNKKLGWQIANVVFRTELFAAVHHLPGRAGVASFLKAAKRKGVSPELIERARAAVEGMERLIKKHAGDRQSFEMMVSGCSGNRLPDVNLSQRRAWFAGAGLVWGVQAQTQIGAAFVFPSSRAEWVDIAFCSGLVQLRRIRPGIPCVIMTSKALTDDGSARQQPMREPLDPGMAGKDGPPIMRRFCSPTFPEIRRRVSADGFQVDEVVGGPVGDTGTIDCVTGELMREFNPRYRTEHDWLWWAVARVRTPSRLLILDEFIHEDVFGQIHPEAYVYRDWADQLYVPPPLRRKDRIPWFAPVERLGKGMAGIRIAEVPRYAELVRYVFERCGWDANRSQGFRVRIKYPVVPTTVTMESPLPEPPTT